LRNPNNYPCAEAAELKAAVSIAAIIAETLALRREGNLWVALCPFHGERSPSFYVYPTGYHCFGCGAHGDVFEWLMAGRRMTFPQAVAYVGGQPGRLAHPLPAPTQAPRKSKTTADTFMRCWSQGINPSGSIVETYLRSRGDLIIPECAAIRFHPRCQRGSRDLPGGPEYWPAMLALMTDPLTGEPVGVHCTFLRPDGSGKAAETRHGDKALKPKMIRGTWGVVRLVADDQIGRALGIAEGIENALTASQAIGWGPVWAAGTQNGIARFPVLPWIEALTIFADADDSGVGLAAARACAERWEDADRECAVCVPPIGLDWNDASRRIVV
jgi:CHC2 zinc finger/Toprim domain